MNSCLSTRPIAQSSLTISCFPSKYSPCNSAQKGNVRSKITDFFGPWATA